MLAPRPSPHWPQPEAPRFLQQQGGHEGLGLRGACQQEHRRRCQPCRSVCSSEHSLSAILQADLYAGAFHLLWWRPSHLVRFERQSLDLNGRGRSGTKCPRLCRCSSNPSAACTGCAPWAGHLTFPSACPCLSQWGAYHVPHSKSK